MMSPTPIKNKFQRSVVCLADLKRSPYPLSQRTYQDQLYWVRGTLAELNSGELNPKNKPSKWFWDDREERYAYAAGIVTCVSPTTHRNTKNKSKHNGIIHIESPMGSGIIRYIFNCLSYTCDYHLGRTVHFKYPVKDLTRSDADFEPFFHREDNGVICNPSPLSKVRNSINVCVPKCGGIKHPLRR